LVLCRFWRGIGFYDGELRATRGEYLLHCRRFMHAGHGPIPAVTVGGIDYVEKEDFPDAGISLPYPGIL
jgi:hypothetical protein